MLNINNLFELHIILTLYFGNEAFCRTVDSTYKNNQQIKSTKIDISIGQTEKILGL